MRKTPTWIATALLMMGWYVMTSGYPGRRLDGPYRYYSDCAKAAAGLRDAGYDVGYGCQLF